MTQFAAICVGNVTKFFSYITIYKGLSFPLILIVILTFNDLQGTVSPIDFFPNGRPQFGWLHSHSFVFKFCVCR